MIGNSTHKSDASEMNYPDGPEVIVGDHVDFDGWSAIVVEIIDSPKAREWWGLEENGVFFETKEVGLVFQGNRDLGWDTTIRLLRRATPP